MKHEFDIEFTPQEEWGWILAVNLFLGGLGGGLFLLFLFVNLSSSLAIVSLGAVGIGGLVLMMELGRPLRAWRALTNPRSSWISRGVIFVVLFIIFGALYIAPISSLFSWLPWTASTSGGRAIGIVAGVSALFVTLYPGFVLAASPSIPFWNNPLLPVLFLCQSLMAATGLAFLLAPLEPSDTVAQTMSLIGGIIIVVNLVLGAMYLAVSRGTNLAAKESVRLLTVGSLGYGFNGGVVVAGMIIPLLVVLFAPAAMPLAGLLIVIGGLLFRYCVLKAGVYAALL